MALATKCPHCNTIFRVAHDQLKLRGGIVRCGSCNEVFDGNAALVEPAAAKAPVAPPPVAVPTSISIPVSTASDAPAPIQPKPPEAPAAFDAAMEALDTRATEALQADAPEALSHLDVETDDAEDAHPDEHQPEQEQEPEPESAAPSAADEADVVSSPVAEAPLELDLDVELDAEFEPELEPEPGLDAEPDQEVEAELASESKSESESESESEPEAEPEPEQEIAPELEPEPESETELEAPHADKTGTYDIDLDLSGDDGLAAKSDEEIIAELAALSAADGVAEPSFDAIVDLATEFSGEPAADDDALDSRREPTLGEPPSEHLVAAALADSHHDDLEDTRDDDAAAAAQAEQAEAEAGAEAAEHEAAFDAAETSHATETVINDTGASADPAANDEDEPGFVKRDRRRQKMGKAARIGMAVGSVALLGALLAQGIGTFRNQLAAELPQLKPTLSKVCATLGCKVELPTQIDDLSIEPGELQTVAENTYSFTTLLRNGGGITQTWPHIELVLNDNADKPVLRRVFAPRDYLGAAADATPAAAASLAAQGFAPHSEQSVKLYFEIAQLKASGYHIAVFYP